MEFSSSTMSMILPGIPRHIAVLLSSLHQCRSYCNLSKTNSTIIWRYTSIDVHSKRQPFQPLLQKFEQQLVLKYATAQSHNVQSRLFSCFKACGCQQFRN